MNSFRLFLSLLLPFIAATANSNTFKAGFAREPINPKITDTWTDLNRNFRYDEGEPWTDTNNNGRFDAVYLAGFGRPRIAQSNHDPIYATASVLELGTTRIAIVAIDAIGFMHEELLDLRSQLPQHLNIDYLVSHATHNHETPDTLGFWGKSRWQTGINPNYQAFVKKTMLKAVERATQRLQPAKLQAVEVASAMNLDVEDTRLPQVIEHGIRVFRFININTKETLGTWINWANHVETLWSNNLSISSDFVHYLREGLEVIDHRNPLYQSAVGGITLFLTGNVGGLMTTSPRVTVQDHLSGTKFKDPSFKKAQAQGYKLAFHILAGLESASSEVPTQLDFQQQSVHIPVANWKMRLAQLLKIIRRDIDWRGRTLSEVGALQIGTNQVLLIPGELYPEIAIGGIENLPGADEIIDVSKFKPLKSYMRGNIKMTVNLANDSIGYIIPRSQWDNKAPWSGPGGKKTYGEVNSLGIETADIIYEAAVQALEKLSR